MNLIGPLSILDNRGIGSGRCMFLGPPQWTAFGATLAKPVLIARRHVAGKDGVMHVGVGKQILDFDEVGIHPGAANAKGREKM